MNTELLIKAGVVAANKWNIDPSEITIKFVESLETFLIGIPQVSEIKNPPCEWRPETLHDVIAFEQYSDTHFGNREDQFLLAWGPKSKTLVICYLLSIWGKSPAYGKGKGYSIGGGVMTGQDTSPEFTYRRAARCMAVHIQGILAKLQPDGHYEDGIYPTVTPEKTEELFLLTRLFTGTWPAKGVFDELQKEVDEVDEAERD